MSEFPKPALPARPHLNWLRNRAKEKLAALRPANPSARLAEAQLAIAREYGFASWRNLKAYVDAIHDQGEAIVQGHWIPRSPRPSTAAAGSPRCAGPGGIGAAWTPRRTPDVPSV